MDISGDTSVDGVRAEIVTKLRRKLRKILQAKSLDEPVLRLMARCFAGAGVGVAQAAPIVTFFVQQELTSVPLLGKS
jgi:hypothetical protein